MQAIDPLEKTNPQCGIDHPHLLAAIRFVGVLGCDQLPTSTTNVVSIDTTTCLEQDSCLVLCYQHTLLGIFQ